MPSSLSLTAALLAPLGLLACGGSTALEDGLGGASPRPSASGTAGTTGPTAPGPGRPQPVPTLTPPTSTPPPATSAPPPDPGVDPPTPRKCSLAVPPAKKFSDLTDAQFATLCEFLACSRGGYGSREISCPNGTRTISMPNTLAECIDAERSAALAAGSACQLTMGMLDACYGPWGDNLCVQPGACKAIDAVAITCN